MDEQNRRYAGVGSRETPPLMLLWMERIAGHLVGRGWTLRSGGARGADQAFERGANAARGQTEIYRSEDATAKAIEIAARYHDAWGRLDAYARGLMGRNVQVVAGRTPEARGAEVACVIGWTPGGRGRGGTGHTFRVAQAMNVTVVDLALIARERPMPQRTPKEIEQAIMATRPDESERKLPAHDLRARSVQARG